MSLLFKLIHGVLRHTGCGDSPSPRAKRACGELKTAHTGAIKPSWVWLRARDTERERGAIDCARILKTASTFIFCSAHRRLLHALDPESLNRLPLFYFARLSFFARRESNLDFGFCLALAHSIACKPAAPGVSQYASKRVRKLYGARTSSAPSRNSPSSSPSASLIPAAENWMDGGTWVTYVMTRQLLNYCVTFENYLAHKWDQWMKYFSTLPLVWLMFFYGKYWYPVRSNF